MSKSQHLAEQIIQMVREYLSGAGSYDKIAKAHGISGRTLRGWVRRFQEHRENAFYSGNGTRCYNKALKTKCVEVVLSGQGTVDDIVAKYNISDRRVLRNWIVCYNANMELKDYEPKPEVYMAEARRKTTLEER